MAALSLTRLFTDSALQGYWPLDGDFTDKSANAYSLTSHNTPTFVVGRYKQAASFVAASTQYADIGHASIPNLEISGSQTWVCWVNPTTIVSYQVSMGLAAADGSNIRCLLLNQDVGNSILFQLPGLTTNTSVSTPANALGAGIWHHVAGVYNSATTSLSIFIDGVSVGSVTASGSPTAYINGGFAMGARAGTPAFYMDGLVDDAAIFSRALSTDEILILAKDRTGIMTADI